MRRLIESASGCYEQAWANVIAGGSVYPSQDILSATWNPVRQLSSEGIIAGTHQSSLTAADRTNEDAAAEDSETDAVTAPSLTAAVHLKKQLSLLSDNTEL